MLEQGLAQVLRTIEIPKGTPLQMYNAFPPKFVSGYNKREIKE